MRHTIAFTLALLTASPSVSLAQQRPRAAAPDGLDLVLATAGEWGGAQGVYTCEQWRQYLQRIYNIADKRRRGYFDAQDFEAVRRASSVFRSASFDYFDMSGKGRVTKQEFLAFPSPFFERYDKRKTCRVRQEEIARARPPSGGAPSSPSSPSARPPSYGSGFSGRGGGYGGGGFGGYGGGYGGGMGR